MTTYNKILNSDDKFLEKQDDVTKTAVKIMNVFHDRKGFDWWFDDIPTDCKNEIFKEITNILKAN